MTADDAPAPPALTPAERLALALGTAGAAGAPETTETPETSPERTTT